MHVIRDHSNIDQWHYVNTAENPTDIVLRELDVPQKNSDERWFQGPAFIWQNQDTLDLIETSPAPSMMNDPKVKKNVVANAVLTN